MRTDIVSDTESSAVKSAMRALDVIEYLAKLDRPVTHGEIADSLAIPKSSLSKLLRTLQARHYVEYVQGDHAGFRIGKRLGSLVKAEAAKFDLIELGRPSLRKIVAVTGESAALNKLQDDVVEVIASEQGPQRLSTTMRLGDVAPLYATSGGKVLLANMPDSWINEYVSKVTFVPVTPNTIRDATALKQELKNVRDKGFAYSFNEFTPGITGIAKAILSPDGRAIASLNVTIPSVRYTEATRSKVEDAISKAVSALERLQRKHD